MLRNFLVFLLIVFDRILGFLSEYDGLLLGVYGQECHVVLKFRYGQVIQLEKFDPKLMRNI